MSRKIHHDDQHINRWYKSLHILHVFFSFPSDVNECEELADICGNGICTDTEESYFCTCGNGFEEAGGICLGKIHIKFNSISASSVTN